MGSPQGSPKLWRPGCTSYPAGRQVLDPIASKQELEKLYELMPESSYDLSLKDLVDPSYSINGEFTALDHKKVSVKSEESWQRSEYHSMQHCDGKKLKTSSKYSFIHCYSFPGRYTTNLFSDFVPLGDLTGTTDMKPSACNPGSLPPKSSLLNRAAPSFRISRSFLKRSLSIFSKAVSLIECSVVSSLPKCYFTWASETNAKRVSDCQQVAFSASQVHPFNNCSSCSSYTIFFKTHCRVCRKLYCSNCAKDAMEFVPEGRKCKIDCSDKTLAKRHLLNSSKCVPSCIAGKVRDSVKSNKW
eukprot:c24274_g4_i2 orf=374-1273(+)